MEGSQSRHQNKARIISRFPSFNSIWEAQPLCDIQELYRYLVDDFVIRFCEALRKKDFITKSESVSRNRKGKREYLNNAETRRMMMEMNEYFESKVDIPLIRHGKRQRIETLINEEAMLLAKYLRDETQTWVPRIANR